MTFPPVDDTALPGLLAGVKVVDLTHYISGPYCTKLLATLGADVVKIERPGSGDPMRRVGPFAEPSRTSPEASAAARHPGPEADIRDETGAWFLYLNTSKKSLALDLKSPQGSFWRCSGRGTRPRAAFGAGGSVNPCISQIPMQQ